VSQGSALFARIYFSTVVPAGFVYFKRQVSGLSPATEYTVRFLGEIATNTPSGCGGFEGTPEQSAVYAGATTFEPRSSLAGNRGPVPNFRLASETEPSPDGVYLGNVGTSTQCPNFSVWQIKALQSAASISVRTDSSGSVWLHQAAATAYSDYITVYFTRLSVAFAPA
jgi:hypothetical protein